MARFPSISQQFASAKPTRPFVRTGRLQRRAKTSAGEDWVSLPHSAYFIDPLLSAGNAHTLIGIERLTEIFNRHWGKTSLAQHLANYNAKLQREIDFLDLLIHGCYGAFKHFEFFTEFSMYYFAGAIYSEHRRRQNRHCGEDEFLFSHHPPFKAAVSKGYETLQKMADNQPVLDSSNQLRERVTQDIKPYNITGLCRLEKNNMYPFV